MQSGSNHFRGDDDKQEIYMYDIATKEVSRLKGELSTAFVSVAESNADAQMHDNADEQSVQLIDDRVFERMPALDAPQPKQAVTIIEAQSSKSHRGHPVFPHGHHGSAPAAASTSSVSISSGYSVIKR